MIINLILKEGACNPTYICARAVLADRVTRSIDRSTLRCRLGQAPRDSRLAQCYCDMENVEPKDLGITEYAICKEDNITTYKYYNMSAVEDVTIVFHSIFLSILLVVGVFGNSFVLFMVAKDKRLQYRSIIVTLSIVVVDLLLLTFQYGVALLSDIKREWIFGSSDYNTCRGLSIIITYLYYVRWVALAATATNRFLTVRFPFHYRTYSRAILLVLTTLNWVFPALVSVTSLLPITTSTYRTYMPGCVPNCNAINTTNSCLAVRGFNFLFTIVVGVVPSILYTWMFRKGRRLHSKYVLGEFALTVTAATTKAKTMFKYYESKRNRNALTTLTFLYISGIITTLPRFITDIFIIISPCEFFRIPLSVQYICSGIFALYTVLDPIIIIRNGDFRKSIKELLQRKCCAKKQKGSLEQSHNGRV